MARPVAIHDPTILDAAREVFLLRGAAATTAEVARRAGVSEGSIFKRYRTKHGLLEAVVADVEREPAFISELPARVGAGHVFANLEWLAGELLEYFRRAAPVHLLAWSAPSGPRGRVLLSAASPPLATLRKVAGYFEAEMHLGRIRRADAEVVARSFVGALGNFVLLELLANAPESSPMPEQSYIRGYVAVLARGLEPDAPWPRPAA
mgnify:FL=1